MDKSERNTEKSTDPLDRLGRDMDKSPKPMDNSGLDKEMCHDPVTYLMPFASYNPSPQRTT